MRTVALSLVIALCCTSFFAQNTEPKASAGTTRSQSEAQKPATKPSPQAAADEADSLGPWKGLQYRLVGPFRGGRVVAASGVVDACPDHGEWRPQLVAGIRREFALPLEGNAAALE